MNDVEFVMMRIQEGVGEDADVITSMDGHDFSGEYAPWMDECFMVPRMLHDEWVEVKRRLDNLRVALYAISEASCHIRRWSKSRVAE